MKPLRAQRHLQSANQSQNAFEDDTEGNEQSLKLNVDLDDEDGELLDLAVVLDFVEGSGSLL